MSDETAGLLDPASIYRAPMTEVPPASSWRLGSGNYIEESRGLLLSAPAAQASPGLITCYSAEYVEHPVAIEWTKNEAYIVPARVTRIPFGALVAMWGEDAKTWPAGRKVHPGSLQHLVWPWMTKNTLPSQEVKRRA